MIYGKTLDEGLGPEYYVQKLNNFPPLGNPLGPFPSPGREEAVAFPLHRFSPKRPNE